MTFKNEVPSTEIKTRPALVKALDAAKITGYEIRGRGASLEVVLKNGRDYNKFRRTVAQWSGYSTGWGGFVAQKTKAYRPGSEHDFNNPASCHHY